VLVAPVRIATATRGSRTSALASSSSQTISCSASSGTPASHSCSASALPTSGVSSGGLNSTRQPAISAAKMPPAAMASGKFQGGATSTTPRGASETGCSRNRRKVLAR
jgi:hypothetical protein